MLRDSFGGFHTTTVVDAFSGTEHARNLGCSLEARHSRTDPGRFDYLVAYVSSDGGAPETAFRYLRDNAMGTTSDREFGAVRFGLPSIDPGRFDVAVDETDRFWATTGTAEVFGENGSELMFEPVSVRAVGGSGFGQHPRLAARGNGELAVVATDQFNRLTYAHRQPGEDEFPQLPLVPSDGTITSYPSSPSDLSVAGEDVTPTFLNNGGIASADALYGGIPLSVTFSPDEPTGPVIAWAAGRPNGMAYNALMIARPGQMDGQFDLETIDGVIMMSGAVHVATDAIGRTRVVYHNGLDANRPDTTNLAEVEESFGVLHYYREEDEDEIFRRTDHPRRGDLRCFAERLFAQNQHTDRRVANSALDQFSADLRVHPSIDPDPCGRTADPGLAEDIGYAYYRALSGDPPPTRPESRFARFDGESPLEFAVRTNVYRRLAFRTLRHALGNMGVFDSVFPHPSGSWSTFDPAQVDPAVPNDPATDPFLDNASGRAGLLDTIFLSLDEMLDDFCGQRTNAILCDDDSLTRYDERCEAPGLFERNPNPFFRGMFATEEIALEQINGYVSPEQPGEDFSSITSLRDSFSGGHDSEDEINEVGLTGLDSRGVLGAALRGVGFSEAGLSRRMDHACFPLEADALELPGVYPNNICRFGVFALTGDFPDGTAIIDAPSTDSPDIGQASGACPPFRPGAMPGGLSRFDPATFMPREVPTLTQIGNSEFGCCAGYSPATCADSLDCPAPAEIPFIAFRDCVDGFCSDAGAPICIPDVCTQPSTSYCDDTTPEAPPFWALPNPTMCGVIPTECPPDIASNEGTRCAAECAPGVAGQCEVTIECRRRLASFNDQVAIERAGLYTPRDVLALVRANACGPGASCESNERFPPAVPIARPLLGHWGIGVIGQFAGTAIQQIASTASGLISFGDLGSAISFSERISEVRTQWRARRDGGLLLQGVYELVIRLDDPSILGEVDLGVNAVEVEASRFVARLQPYYAPRAHPQVPGCDSCRRRMPDLDVHFAVVEGGIFYDSDTVERAPDVSGCVCSSRSIANCFLGCKPQTIGGMRVDDLDEVDPALSAQITGSVEDQLNNLDNLLYRLTSDQLIGGLLFGRDAAVSAIIDAPECPASLDPGTVNCRIGTDETPAGTGVSPRRIRGADSIELLRIVEGGAEPIGRDNP